MPTIENFNGQQIVEPGAYSRITSAFNAPPVTGTYGVVVLVDTGSGAGFGWGAGVLGELSSDTDAAYFFDTSLDAKNAIRGGLLWDLMDYLWAPSNNGGGPTRLYLIKAAATTAPALSLAFNVGGTAIIKARNEGVGGNGVLDGTGLVLIKGYGAKMRAGYGDNTKFVIDFYEGTYRGVDGNGVDFDTSAVNVVNNIIATTPEMTSTDDFIYWMANDPVFIQYFKLITSPTAFQPFNNTDITTLGAAILLFTNGTTTYSSGAVDSALAAIEEIDSSLFLCDDYGVTAAPNGGQIAVGANKGAESTANTKILSHILNNALYTDKIMFVGGGQTAAQFNTNNPSAPGTVEVAQYYNSECVVVAHSDVKVPAKADYVSSLYHAAMICGRTAGLLPQVPLTFKDIRVTGVRHILKKAQRGQALQKGVCHLRKLPQLGWAVNQGVNTLQVNSTLINSNGTTPEISIKRVKHQMNKELVQGAIIQFPGNNFNNVEPADVKAYTESYLLARTAQKTADNMIISFKNVVVTFANGNYNTKYCFVVNGPVNKLFFTGYMLDPTVIANQAAASQQ